MSKKNGSKDPQELVVPKELIDSYSKEANENEQLCRQLIEHCVTEPPFKSDVLHLLCDYYSASSVVRDLISQIGEEEYFDEKTQKIYHYVTSVQLAALSACITISQNCEDSLSKKNISLKTH